jgi:hypothetical protein
VSPGLTPLSEGTETLTPLTVGSESLTLIADDAQTLGSLPDPRFGYEFLRPSSFTYPGATTYPGLYGEEMGLRLDPLSEGSETLTPLTED